jgi:hypothetical protein
MVDTDFGDDVTRMPFASGSVSDLNFTHSDLSRRNKNPHRAPPICLKLKKFFALSGLSITRILYTSGYHESDSRGKRIPPKEPTFGVFNPSDFRV